MMISSSLSLAFSENRWPMPDALFLDLVHIATSLTIGTLAVHITLSGILRSSIAQEIYLSGI